MFITDSVAADQVDDVAGSRLAAELESELANSQAESISRDSSKVLATPAVRRIAGENKVHDLWKTIVLNNACTTSIDTYRYFS